MTYFFDPPPDDGPVDPNPQYVGPPPAAGYPPPPGPAPGQPAAYPPPWDSGRPGGVFAASVLAYIDAGLLILAGLLLFVGASAVDSWSNAFGSSDNGITAELTVDGFINLIAAGLQITGGVLLAARSERGRTLLTIGGSICVLAGVYWVLRIHNVAAVVWSAVFISMPIIAMSMAWAVQATTWLRGSDPRQAHSSGSGHW